LQFETQDGAQTLPCQRPALLADATGSLCSVDALRLPPSRQQLAAMTRKGRGRAHRLMKARILLKADASEAGKGWSDNQIIEALETSASMVYRVRKQLVEEGLEAVFGPQAARHA